MQLQIGKLRRSSSPEAKPLIEELQRIISQLREQIRTMSRD